MKPTATLLIDPPVTPFSSIGEIEAWLSSLRELVSLCGELPELLSAIAVAEGWLQAALSALHSGPS